jgi:hypothetical protein
LPNGNAKVQFIEKQHGKSSQKFLLQTNQASCKWQTGGGAEFWLLPFDVGGSMFI